MLSSYEPALAWLKEQHARMVALTKRWAEINSYSENLAGLAHMASELQEAYQSTFGSHVIVSEHSLKPQKRIDSRGKITLVPLGKALMLKRARSSAKRRVLLSGHLDTVYPADHPFQDCHPIDKTKLSGPGVADLKGGLVVMLLALEAFERSPLAANIEWTVILNPDEEIGSTGSESLLDAAAREHDVGLVFEPALPDGSYVSARRGSANYHLVVHGKAAHAGRDFHLGRNAIELLLPLMQQLSQITDIEAGTTVNLGGLQAGGPVNIVPDLAILRFNLRATSAEAMAAAQAKVVKICDGFELLEVASRGPKVFDAHTERFYHEIKEKCTKPVGINMHWQSSGGVCDGNILAEAGLPTIDTLGPIGGHLHTEQEYVQLDSLVPRAQVATMILMRLADGTFDLPV